VISWLTVVVSLVLLVISLVKIRGAAKTVVIFTMAVVDFPEADGYFADAGC
jgi:hypothetical protein